MGFGGGVGWVGWLVGVGMGFGDVDLVDGMC
jgi:hypothetical protein